MTDFQMGFRFGVALGLGFAALVIALAPERYVAMLDRTTFKYMWLRLAIRTALMRLFGRGPSPLERDAATMLRSRVDSAIARREDSRVTTEARGMGVVVAGLCALGALWPHALVAAASLAVLAIAIFLLRLEGRTPDGASRRAALLRPRPAFDPALGIAIGVAAVLVAGALGLAAADSALTGRVELAIGGAFGVIILGLALRLARRPAAISADDVAMDAYVDEQLRTTRVAYLLFLSLCPIAFALLGAVRMGADGTILRVTYEAGFAIVLLAWFSAGLRGPRAAGA
ncbi:MAG TPA: hypothetical protein VK669_00320 [Candidatus Limnocylindrales bacterium]|nr:hypothetical protein [Candidatus Limnocylindrales bacterium]